MSRLDLSSIGITVEDVFRNLPPAQLYEEAIRVEPETAISDTGALIAYSGEKTGRSPSDKRVVRMADSEDQVWWGPVNYALEEQSFRVNHERAIDYLNTRSQLYVVDGYAGWDRATRIKVRVICCRPYHALFMHNMLIRPSEEGLQKYGEPDMTIYNAGSFPANRYTSGMTSKTSVDLSLEEREAVILGTEYAGEMKKAVFTYANYAYPRDGILSMHCSATSDENGDNAAVLFGLSGTGKTTLSADPSRYLIGDDEHGWGPDGIFNIEGGCYAKAVYLTQEAEPQIFDSLRFGAVLENVVYDEADHHVDFNDTRLTENTRGAYPIEYIDNARIPCVAGHPKNIIFLTCDAFGVLPPISKLTPEQAEYHFISGYTAKIAGTEQGITEPQATFSPCFGGPFLVWHPGKYAELLSELINKHDANVWLINTGWSGGGYGEGDRMKLAYTRSMVSAIYDDSLRDAPTERDSVFGLDVVTAVPNVPSEILVPRNTWSDAAAYDAAAQNLATLFKNNFIEYADKVRPEVVAAGPV